MKNWNKVKLYDKLSTKVCEISRTPQKPLIEIKY